MFQRGCKTCPGKPQRPQGVKNLFFNRRSLERATIGGESPVDEKEEASDTFLSTAGHEKSRGKPGGPPSKAKYHLRPIVYQYREGKVKRTPRGE
jgi:hypothetical protein